MDLSNTKIMLGQWGIPNSMTRSALFSTKSLGEDREFHINKVIHSQSTYEIVHTGPEMNQCDAQVLYAITHLQRASGKRFGEWTIAYQKDVADLIGRKPSGESFESIVASMERLKISTIKIKDKEDTYVGGIVDAFIKSKTKHLEFRLSPDLEAIFNSDCTIVKLEHKVMLTRLISKWLHDFSMSHSCSIPFSLDYLMRISGYVNSKSEFRRQLELSCLEIEQSLGDKSPFVGHSIENDELRLYKHKKSSDVIPSLPAFIGGERKNPYL